MQIQKEVHFIDEKLKELVNHGEKEVNKLNEKSIRIHRTSFRNTIGNDNPILNKYDSLNTQN